jgi:tRNA dimethylallyltransferase
MNEKIICIMGPTASGKTALAMQLVQQDPRFEIVSVDSAMVYRGLDIGAAKPTREELEAAPHHLIDLREIDQPYSAADFVVDANRVIKEILARGNRPLLVGGTMLYFKALQQGMAELPAADEALRKQIADESEQLGWEAMHSKLAEVDPQSAAKIHPNDPQRLSRALEVYRLTGKPLSEHFGNEQASEFEFHNIGLLPEDRSWLHQRIALRFEQMLQQGFVEEVKSLMALSGFDADLPAFRSVGYRQVIQFLQGELSEAEMLERGIIATRQLAKRQITWLRAWPQLDVIPCDRSDYTLSNILEV